jgi:hypothetical protein
VKKRGGYEEERPMVSVEIQALHELEKRILKVDDPEMMKQMETEMVGNGPLVSDEVS